MTGLFTDFLIFSMNNKLMGRRTKEPLMKVKGSEKVGLKLNVEKTKIMASGPITSWQIDGEIVESVADFILGEDPKSLQMVITPWTAAHRASLSITNSQSLLTLMSIKSVIPSNHLIHCHPLLLLSSVFLSTRVFSNESVLHIRWPKYWSFSFSISTSNEYSGLISFRIDWFDLLSVHGALPRSPALQEDSLPAEPQEKQNNPYN